MVSGSQREPDGRPPRATGNARGGAPPLAGRGATDRLRIGVVGAGFVAQVVHLPHLADAADRFEVVALAEPDARVRTVVAARHRVAAAFATQAEMHASARLDAVLIASPNTTHADA